MDPGVRDRLLIHLYSFMTAGQIALLRYDDIAVRDPGTGYIEVRRQFRVNTWNVRGRVSGPGDASAADHQRRHGRAARGLPRSDGAHRRTGRCPVCVPTHNRPVVRSSTSVSISVSRTTQNFPSTRDPVHTNGNAVLDYRPEVGPHLFPSPQTGRALSRWSICHVCRSYQGGDPKPSGARDTQKDVDRGVQEPARLPPVRRSDSA
jgi:hypothetical protein